jgi:RluA family pseudouridine synthase
MNTIKLSAPTTKEFWEIPVLFEDEHLLALDKPSGLLTSPDRYNLERPNLMQLLHQGIAAKKPWSATRGLTYLSNAHRLDAETTGVLLLAKNKPALIHLANLFSIDKVQQKYFALASGLPSSDEFVMDARIASNVVELGLMRIDNRDGMKSKTEFSIAEKFSGYVALNCHPRSNRNHQIRIHLKHAGFPIVGDTLYGGKPLWLSRLKKDFYLKRGREERPLMARVALHSEELCFPHTITGETIAITSPIPKDLRVALRYLREFRGNGRTFGAPEDEE